MSEVQIQSNPKLLSEYKSKWELPVKYTTEQLLQMLPEKCRKGKTVIIDPVSPEFNRGSFCYMGYLLFSAMQSLGCNVVILENFCAADVDNLPHDADQFLIVLWNHTQIEHVQTLIRFLPKGKCLVFGFYNMIDGQHLPKYEVPAEIIQRGMVTYYKNFRFFKQILLSDCDMHLKGCSGQVYPFFTTYGCPRGCNFCPTTINLPPQDRTGGRIATPLPELFEVFTDMIENHKMVNWHFTDEDFYIDTDRCAAVCKWLKNYTMIKGQKFQIITLGERHTVNKFVEKYGWELLEAAGIKLIEIGLESAEDDLGKTMGKGGVKLCHKLAQECKDKTQGRIRIMWLTMAFYPGETIQSLNKTGDFMKANGLGLDELYERITTNGTWGGLGQFTQFYEGYKRRNDGSILSVDEVQLDGVVFSHRPLRLMPSFVPNSFINDKIKGHSGAESSREMEDSDLVWFDNYRIEPPKFDDIFPGESIGEVVRRQYRNPLDGYLALAVASKIRLIV